MSLSKTFITGCDSNTEWMLMWFLTEYWKHNDTPITVFDFGMTPEFVRELNGLWPPLVQPLKSQDVRWFKKPKAMIAGTKIARQVCWIDTDCHVRDDISDIFNYVEPNRLAMVEDVPWSTRRGEKWHNSGVVAFQDRPNILDQWATAIINAPKDNPMYGDQDVLHELVKDGMKRMIHIADLPREYNTLRLDLVDKTAPAKPKIMHWTGPKGKDEIRKIAND